LFGTGTLNRPESEDGGEYELSFPPEGGGGGDGGGGEGAGEESLLEGEVGTTKRSSAVALEAKNVKPMDTIVAVKAKVRRVGNLIWLLMTGLGWAVGLTPKSGSLT